MDARKDIQQDEQDVQDGARRAVTSRQSCTSLLNMDAAAGSVERLVSQIIAAVHPLRIILFGSAARGQTGPDSDLDVLVVMPDGTPRLETARELYRRIRGVGAPFDILVATPALIERHRDNPGLVYRTVLREGRTVYAA